LGLGCYIASDRNEPLTQPNLGLAILSNAEKENPMGESGVGFSPDEAERGTARKGLRALPNNLGTTWKSLVSD
jgi:hypothetical protein